jgi:hypothetical protein
VKGGWSWFCLIMLDKIIDGKYNDFINPMPKLEAIVGRGGQTPGSGYWRMWLHVANRGTDFYRVTKWSCSFSYKGELVHEDTFYVEQVAARQITNKMVTLWTARGIDYGECRLLDTIKGRQN